MLTVLATQCCLYFDEIRMIKFIACIYICFNQNIDEKSSISAKFEPVTHVHTVFSANSGTASITS